MPDYDKTEIVIVLDRSGSMARIAEDMEGGLETFLAEQKKVAGRSTVSLYQFDAVVERVFRGKDLEEVDRIRLLPRGQTALHDALGLAIDDTARRLAKLDHTDRPGNVVVLIITDGRENGSMKFTKKRIFEMVDYQRKEHGWQFAYLGTEESTLRDAAEIGIQGSSYQKDAAGIRGMAVGLSVSIESYRRERRQGNLSATLDMRPNLEPRTPTTR